VTAAAESRTCNHVWPAADGGDPLAVIDAIREAASSMAKLGFACREPHPNRQLYESSRG
jgi:hypothetical protein